MLGDMTREALLCIVSNSTIKERDASLREVASPLPSLQSSVPLPTDGLRVFLRMGAPTGQSSSVPVAAWITTTDGTLRAEQPVGASKAVSLSAPTQLTQKTIV